MSITKFTFCERLSFAFVTLCDILWMKDFISNGENMRTIGDTIKLLREERRLSQQALADGLNVKRSTISMWEAGKRAPNDELKEHICDFFNVDLNFLYGVTDCRNSAREHPESYSNGDVKYDNNAQNQYEVLAKNEKNLLDIYRDLDDKGQHTVDTVARMELGRVKEEK